MINTLMPYTVNLTSIDAAGNERGITSISEGAANTSATLQGIIQTFGEPAPDAAINIPVQKILDFMTPKFLTNDFKPLMEFVAQELTQRYNQNVPRPNPASSQKVQELLENKYSIDKKINIMTIVELVQAADYLGIPEIYRAGIQIIAITLMHNITIDKFCNMLKSINADKPNDLNTTIATFRLEDSLRKNGCARLLAQLNPSLVFESIQPFLTIQAHEGTIFAVAFSPKGRYFATGGADNRVKIWRTHTGELIHTLEGHERHISSLAYSPDGKQLVSGSFDGTAKIWDTKTGALLHTLTDPAPPAHLGTTSITSVAYHPSAPVIATGSYDTTVRLWNANTGELIRIVQQHLGLVNALAFSPDGTKIAVGSSDNFARLWQITIPESAIEEENQPILLHTFSGHTSSINCLAFNPQGTPLITGSIDETVRLWDASTGRYLLSLLIKQGPVWSVNISHNGTRIIIASQGLTSIWSYPIITQLFTLTPTQGTIISTAFSSNNRYVLTGTNQDEAILWKYVNLTDRKGNISLEQALLLILLENIQKTGGALNLSETDLCTNLMRKVFETFNQNARAYLIKKYQIIVEKAGESSSSKAGFIERTKERAKKLFQRK